MLDEAQRCTSNLISGTNVAEAFGPTTDFIDHVPCEHTLPTWLAVSGEISNSAKLLDLLKLGRVEEAGPMSEVHAFEKGRGTSLAWLDSLLHLSLDQRPKAALDLRPRCEEFPKQLRLSRAVLNQGVSEEILEQDVGELSVDLDLVALDREAISLVV